MVDGLSRGFRTEPLRMLAGGHGSKEGTMCSSARPLSHGSCRAREETLGELFSVDLRLHRTEIISCGFMQVHAGIIAQKGLTATLHR